MFYMASTEKQYLLSQRWLSFYLPEQDIDSSLNEKGAIAYKAVVDGDMVDGAVVVIDKATQHNHLHLLYVKYGIQTKGIGFLIWNQIEKLYPQTIGDGGDGMFVFKKQM